MVTGRSLLKFPLSRTTFLLTPDTAVRLHNSDLLFSQALDAVPDCFVLSVVVVVLGVLLTSSLADR